MVFGCSQPSPPNRLQIAPDVFSKAHAQSQIRELEGTAVKGPLRTVNFPSWKHGRRYHWTAFRTPATGMQLDI